MIKRTLLVIMLYAFASAATASVLRYDFEFFAVGEKTAPVHDSDYYYLEGSGFLFADTELDAIIGGRLESPDIAFSWYDPAPSPLTFLGDYYGAERVSAGRAHGINEKTGEPGYLRLGFLLWPGGGAPYAERLDSNRLIDNYSDLYFPLADPEDSPWDNGSLKADFLIAPPTYADGTPLSVPGPSGFALAVLGLVGLVWRRVSARSEGCSGRGDSEITRPA